MAQTAKELAGVLCSSLKRIMQLMGNPGRFPVPRSRSIMEMQGAECGRSERGLGGQGSSPAEINVIPGSPR